MKYIYNYKIIWSGERIEVYLCEKLIEHLNNWTIEHLTGQSNFFFLFAPIEIIATFVVK